MAELVTCQAKLAVSAVFTPEPLKVAEGLAGTEVNNKVGVGHLILQAYEPLVPVPETLPALTSKVWSAQLDQLRVSEVPVQLAHKPPSILHSCEVAGPPPNDHTKAGEVTEVSEGLTGLVVKVTVGGDGLMLQAALSWPQPAGLHTLTLKL